MVDALLRHEAIDVNQIGTNRETALGIAASKSSTDMLALLLAAPVIDVNVVDAKGNTVLYIAAKGTQVHRQISV